MAFRVRGTPFDDIGDYSLWGTKADDYITGDDGNDYIYGSAGSDQIDGGAQIDTVDYGFSPSGVRIRLSYALNQGRDLCLFPGRGGDAQGDTLLYVEKVYGSRYGDELTGDPYDNWLYGREGNDTLRGGDGFDDLDGGADNDFLYGEESQDTLRGGTGNDFIDGGAGVDTLVLDTIGNTGVFITCPTTRHWVGPGCTTPTAIMTESAVSRMSSAPNTTITSSEMATATSSTASTATICCWAWAAST